MPQDGCPLDEERLAILGGETTSASRPVTPPSLLDPAEGAAILTGPYQTDACGLPSAPAVAIPGYEVLGELGRGGMGVVYKARQIGLNRLVALKMIVSGAHAGANERTRFRLEAESIALLKHPHVVQIFEIGESEGRPFFSLEFVSGGSLARRLHGTPLPWQHTAELALALAQAIHTAHQAGIVHRDLKPANVLLTEDGQPKVTDFGMARNLGDDEGPTQTGAVLGTPSYMAPEQAAGQARAAGPPADVYALGAILYEMLTGRPPFRGATLLETLDQVRLQEPVSPRLLQPGIPRDLETICLKCLQKEPGRRYVSAAALAEDLERFRGGRPIAARPVGAVERTWRWCRRNPVLAALTALSLVSLLAGAAVSWYFALEANARARDAQISADNAREEELASQRHLYVSDMNLAQLAWKDAQVGRVLEILDRQRPFSPADLDLRSFEWHYWNQVCHSELVTLHRSTGVVHAVACSPDGRQVATGAADHRVTVWDTTNGHALLLREHAAAVRAVAYHPDGRRLASASLDGVVKVWDVVGGKEISTFKGGYTTLTYSPDGAWLAGASDQNTVKVWDANTGRELFRLAGHDGVVAGVAFRPDGRQLASGSFDSTIRVWDLHTGQTVQVLRGAHDAVYAVAYRGDGLRLAGASYDGTVKVWDATNGRELFTLFGHTDKVIGVTFSPDGERLATASHDRTLRVWDGTTGQQILILRGHTEKLTGLAFTADGRGLVSASYDQQVKVWDAAVHQEGLVLSGHRDRVEALAFHPDGRHLATASDDKTLRVWDLSTGQANLTLRVPAGSFFTGVAFSPDGRLLAGAQGWFHKHQEPVFGDVKIWGAVDGREILSLQEKAAPVHGLSFSPDSERLAAAATDQTVKVWAIHSGRLIHTLTGHTGPVRRVVFGPAGRWLASGSDDRTVILWDTWTGQATLTLRGHGDRVSGVAFSPGGEYLATGSADGTVLLWHIGDGRQLRAFKGHTDKVTTVAFTPDGKRLSTASWDRTVRIWDIVSGREVLTLSGHTDAVTDVAFRPDGHVLASCSWDRTIRLWGAPPPQRRAPASPRTSPTTHALPSPIQQPEVGDRPEQERHGDEMAMGDLLGLVAWRRGGRVAGAAALLPAAGASRSDVLRGGVAERQATRFALEGLRVGPCRRVRP
jgi:WD40 repeat protein/predicted Ser/Thr protein kinase